VFDFVTVNLIDRVLGYQYLLNPFRVFDSLYSSGPWISHLAIHVELLWSSVIEI